MAKALAVDLHRLARFVNTTLLILPLVFIARIQDLVDTPVGIKICVGSLDEVADFIRERKRRDRFPDYISIDAGEGGTGAAPTAFMDKLGMPLYPAIYHRP